MIRTEMIGGAYVRRTFNFGDQRLLPGTVLTSEKLLSIPKTNRRALIEQGYLETWPEIPASVTNPGERHIIRLKSKEYDVIQGTKLNDAPLTYEAAVELAKSKEN